MTFHIEFKSGALCIGVEKDAAKQLKTVELQSGTWLGRFKKKLTMFHITRIEGLGSVFHTCKQLGKEGDWPVPHKHVELLLPVEVYDVDGS